MEVFESDMSPGEAIAALGSEFRTPGHIPVCRESPGGLSNRQGHTELAVAINVMFGITTSEPFPIPSAFSDRCNADVPLDTPTANLAPVNFAKSDSNLRNFGPSVSSVEFNAFNTAFLSSLVISGMINGTFIEASLNASFFFFILITYF